MKYELSCTLHLNTETARDEVYAYLQILAEQDDKTLPGFIEKHDCYHDEGGSCENVTKIEWGG